MEQFWQDLSESILPILIILYVGFMIALMVLAYRPLAPSEDPADRTDATTTPPERRAPATSPDQYRRSLPSRQTARITQCFDPMMWYADHIGKTFDVFRSEYWPREDMIVYWVRTPNGTTNWINDRDCVVVMEVIHGK